MTRKLLFILLTLPTISFGQSTYIPLNQDYYRLMDRYEVISGEMPAGFHSTVKPFQRMEVVRFIDTISANTNINYTKADLFNFNYIRNDNWEFSELDSSLSKRPILKRFYNRKSDFYSVHNEDFDLHVNPVIYFSGGKDFAGNTNTYLNTRGIELRGMINNKVGFYSFFADNQGRFPNYVTNYINTNDAIPGEGFKKPFKENGGVDFITARGYITFNLTKNINAQFGHDKNFIGDGYRSLILSDFSSSYTFLKLNTNIWRINYMNLFTEMNAGTDLAGNLYPKKYLALHHLSLKVTDNIMIGLFESVVFGRSDSTKRGTFDLNYLNPIIFYRSIEQQLGSSDNAILGMNYKVNFLKHFSFYGQIVLDEFLLQEVKARNGWWANKYALQTGLKYFNALGIKNLDLLAEYNVVRPYTYAHVDGYTNYTHYNQPLAHPLGANFNEVVGVLRYQPAGKFNITAKAIYAKYGSDTTTTNNFPDNAGGDISKSYVPVANNKPYGNYIGQGIPNTLMYGSLTLTYQVKHNLFIDLTQVIRNLDSGLMLGI